MICTLKSLYFFDESDTESTQEVSRSPVRDWKTWTHNRVKIFLQEPGRQSE